MSMVSIISASKIESNSPLKRLLAETIDLRNEEADLQRNLTILHADGLEARFYERDE